MKSVFLRAGMLILGILLCANLVVSFLGFTATSYAAKNFQYKVVDFFPWDSNRVEAELNKLSSGGWEVVVINGTTIIFKK